MWSSVQRIHIGFLESFVWSSMNWNWLFSIVISLKKRFVRFHYMKTYTIRIKQYEINIIDLKRGLSVPLWKGHCHPCMQCHTWNYTSSPFNTNPSIHYFSFFILWETFWIFDNGGLWLSTQGCTIGGFFIFIFFCQKLLKWTVH